ncbi:kinase-like domain-containing protein [Globomyces pollinis-pini]|nr:kinase-like domain-containing protein [Globomyces pollinis-pini]
MTQDKLIVGYQMNEIIGEGGQATVRLGFNPKTGHIAAIKILRKKSKSGHEVDRTLLLKELKIHGSISHPNVIRLYKTTEDEQNIYMVLEYAAAGELFDKIEPDVGIDEDLSHLYFTQLVSATEYLHSKGICHRDLKPENLLLDDYGNLKLTDFGLATVFKHNGKTRMLNTPCGTPPYVAPEIHTLSYHGPKVDIWSMGVILFVFLVGNTPWAEPTKNDEEFRDFLTYYPDRLNYFPWTNLSEHALELLVGILKVDSKKRYTMPDIKNSTWYCMSNDMITNGQCNDPASLAERMKSKLAIVEDNESQPYDVSYSQPTDLRYDGGTDFIGQQYVVSFSQPIHVEKSPTKGHPVKASQCHRGPFVDIFPSMNITRFFSVSDANDIMERLLSTLEQFLVPYKKSSENSIAFTTVDRRKCQIHGEISIQPVSSAQLVTFRKSKGDPLEFKRFYKAVYDNVKDITEK